MRLLAAALVTGVALAAFVGLGIERVPEGQVAVQSAEGGEAVVWEEGWHWRAPWSPEPVRLPRRPIEAARDVELTTPEGATIVLRAEGRFAVPEGREAEWLAAAGDGPFLEELGQLLAERLGPRVRALDPAEVFEEGTGRALAAAAAEALARAGVRAEGLVVTAPVERNPVAAAVVRNRLRALAEPTGTKVLVVGWDGADWLMIRPLLEAGRLPNLARLVEGGVSGDLRSEHPLLSPLLWTTIATGKPVTEHGIADFLATDPATGRPVPVSSTLRKVHALWSILSAFDLSADVVAWWATWPAEPVRGTLVSDRVAYQLFDLGDASDGAAGNVYPESAWEWVEDELVAAEEVPFEEVRRFVDLPAAELERRWESLPADRRQEDPVNHLRKILATTRSYHRIGLRLLEEQADLTMLYYEGTDTVGHLFARYLPPRLPGVAAEDVARYGGALPEFYEYADELLGELLARADDDTLVLLVSDHGFFTGEARPESDPADFATGAPQWHRLHGVIVGDGPGVEPGRVEGASIYDLAPSVLAALGLPVPEDLPGEVLRPLLPRAARGRAIGGDRLASYEVLPRPRPRAERLAAADSEERLRELVALGYVSPTALERGGEDGGGGGSPRPAGGPAPAEASRPSESVEGIVTEAYNLGRIYQGKGRLEEAAEQFRLAIRRHSSFALGYASLAQVEGLQGRHSAAFDWLVRGFENSRNMPMSALSGLVDEGKQAGRLADAERVLARLEPAYRSRAPYHAARGLLLEETGRPEQALAAYEHALGIDPLDNLSLERTLALRRRFGREAEARALLEASIGRATSVSAMNKVAVIALRHGWPAQAEGLLRKVLASDPGNPGVLANLAATLAQQGRMAEAADVMRRAVESDPSNAGNYYNLGAMLAEQGRTTEALEAFRQAAAHGLRSPRLHVAAAKMEFRLGDRAAARRELERALQLEPGDPEARQLLRVLEQGG